MHATYLVHSLVATPFFASRAFLATFVVALLCRFAPELAPFVDSDSLKLLAAAPSWFTHDASLAVLGGLATLEFAATKDPDARRLLDEFDALLKAGMSAGVSLALLDAQTTAFVSPLVSGFDPGVLWALLPSVLVLAMATARSRILTSLSDLDPDDDIGLQGLFAWFEDGWVLLGSIFAIVFPLLAVGLLALTIVGLAVAHRAIAWADDRVRQPCGSCEEPLHPTAPSCSRCGVRCASPRRVGLFGQARSGPARPPALHRLDLLSRRRCPCCSERLRGRGPSQECASCGTAAFPDAESLQDYVDHVRRQLPRALAVSFGFGLVPLLGIVPGVIYYRLSLIASLRGYIPRSRGFVSRWLSRLLNLLLIAMQPIPVLGAITLPLMCWTNYRVYRSALVDEMEQLGTSRTAPSPA